MTTIEAPPKDWKDFRSREVPTAVATCPGCNGPIRYYYNGELVIYCHPCSDHRERTPEDRLPAWLAAEKRVDAWLNKEAHQPSQGEV